MATDIEDRNRWIQGLEYYAAEEREMNNSPAKAKPQFIHTISQDNLKSATSLNDALPSHSKSSSLVPQQQPPQKMKA